MAATRETMALASGSTVGRYQLHRVQASWGFYLLYAAQDPAGQPVLIQELLPEELVARGPDGAVTGRDPAALAGWSWARERYLAEGRDLANLAPPGVQKVLEVLEAHGTAYWVLAPDAPGTFKGWLQDLGRAPREDELRRLLGPLLATLEKVHAAGLLHLNLKPETIQLTAEGQPVLTRFAGARQAIARHSHEALAVTTGYSPPEQYDAGRTEDARTDLYSLAAVLHRAMTGQTPPDAEARLAGELGPKLTVRLAGKYGFRFLEAIHVALAISPADRPPSAAIWRRMLGLSSTAEASGDRRPGWIFGGVAVLLAVAGAIWFLLPPPAPHPTPTPTPQNEDPQKEDPKKEDPKKEDPKKEDPKKEEEKKKDEDPASKSAPELQAEKQQAEQEQLAAEQEAKNQAAEWMKAEQEAAEKAQQAEAAARQAEAEKKAAEEAARQAEKAPQAASQQAARQAAEKAAQAKERAAGKAREKAAAKLAAKDAAVDQARAEKVAAEKAVVVEKIDEKLAAQIIAALQRMAKEQADSPDQKDPDQKMKDAQASAQKAAQERQAAERKVAEKAAAEQAAQAESQAAREEQQKLQKAEEAAQAEAQKQTREMAAQKAAAEKLAAEKMAAEKMAAEKMAAEKMAAEKEAGKKKADDEKKGPSGGGGQAPGPGGSGSSGSGLSGIWETTDPGSGANVRLTIFGDGRYLLSGQNSTADHGDFLGLSGSIQMRSDATGDVVAATFIYRGLGFMKTAGALGQREWKRVGVAPDQDPDKPKSKK